MTSLRVNAKSSIDLLQLAIDPTCEKSVALEQSIPFSKIWLSYKQLNLAHFTADKNSQQVRCK